jgi:flagellar protein FlaG
MAIEPISSAIVYSAQPTVRTEAAQNTATETTEGKVSEINAPQVDAETLSVSKAQTENENNGESSKGQQQQQQTQQPPMNDDTIKQALQELTKKRANFQSEFGIHEKTNRITVKIVDKDTKEVIKELPPEKMLDMIAKVWEYAGLFVDEKR